jgi:hypothetical protein
MSHNQIEAPPHRRVNWYLNVPAPHRTTSRARKGLLQEAVSRAQLPTRFTHGPMIYSENMILFVTFLVANFRFAPCRVILRTICGFY